MKSKLKVLILLFILCIISLGFSHSARSGALWVGNNTIAFALNLYHSSKQSVDKYFRTTSEIERLRAANERLSKYETLYLALKSDYADLLSAKKPELPGVMSELVRISSYERLGEHTRFWAQASKDPGTLRGLAEGNNAIGVLSSKEGRPFAISLEDSSCAIAARIGSAQAIVRGDGQQVWADFIEDFSQISLGQEVLTSGMDGIFPAGVYIGKVASIEQQAGYKRALLKDYKSILPFRFVFALKPA